MPNRPILGPNEKAQLIYEIMQFSVTNARIQERATPKSDIFRLMRTIMRDDSEPLRASGNSTYIHELRKCNELFQKVRPFLRNAANCCKTPYCGHLSTQHVDGRCTSNHREWQENGTRPLVPTWNSWGTYDTRYGHWVDILCGCTEYKTSAKW